MRFIIDVQRLRGDQLADEISKATGLDVAQRYALIPPETLEINGSDVARHAETIMQVIEAHQPAAAYWPDERRAEQVRARARAAAASAAGVTLDQLTAAQVRGLVAVLLAKAGAIDETGKVRPLSEWA